MSASKKLNASLWTAQTLLALLFLFAGAMKFVMPATEMTQTSPLPVAFIQFIGVCEVLGGLGLILPGLTRIRTELTWLAAAGLVIIMIGAVVVTAATGPLVTAAVPFVTGVVSVFVAYGRYRVCPLRSRQFGRNVDFSPAASTYR
ncbi:MAG: DoxX family protein [Gemmatimonadaceae bacterium]